LIAQGRGEAFDYLIGEISTESALQAEKAAAAKLLLANKPVISVNGNAAALVPKELIMLSELVNAPLEVNLFHRTEERVDKIIRHLRTLGARNIFTKSDALIPGLLHERQKRIATEYLPRMLCLCLLRTGTGAKPLWIWVKL